MEDDELNEFRQRTFARLIDKRRELQSQELEQAKSQKVAETAFRVTWRENLKKKRAELVSNHVDECILKETLRHFPDVVVGANLDNQQNVSDKLFRASFDNLIADLDAEENIDGYDNGEANVESVLNYDHSNENYFSGYNPSLNSNHADVIKSQQAMQFLKNTMTYNMSVNSRLKAQMRSDIKISNKSYHRDINPFNQSVSQNKLLSSPVLAGFFNSPHYHQLSNQRVFSTFENENQVNELVNHLLINAGVNIGNSLERNGLQRTESMTASNKNRHIDNTMQFPFHSTSQSISAHRRIKTIGLMSNVMNHVTESDRIRSPSYSDANSFIMSPIHRTASFFKNNNNNNNGDLRHRTRSYSNMSDFFQSTAGGGGGHSIGNRKSSQQGGNFEQEINQSNSLFCSLVDSIFLLGPDKKAIMDQIQAHTVTASPDDNVTAKDHLNSVQCTHSTSSYGSMASNYNNNNNHRPFNSNTKNNNLERLGSTSSKYTKNNVYSKNDTSGSNDNGGEGSGASSTGLNSNNNKNTIKTVSEFKAVLDPTIIFMTECNNPEETLTLLPSYCYPSGVDLEVATLINKSTMIGGGPSSLAGGAGGGGGGAGLMRPASSPRKGGLGMLTGSFKGAPNMFASSAATTPRHQRPPPPPPSRTTITKPRAFFPSDSSIADGLSSEKLSRPGSTPRPGGARNNQHNNSQHSLAKTPFVLLLGDQSYQQFCVGWKIPFAFKDLELGVTIYATYTLCLMTRLPLFNYLFHILEQFDEVYEGFKFDAPISTQDMNFPYLTELKPLNELAQRLRRVLVPTLPYLLHHQDSSNLDRVIPIDQQVTKQLLRRPPPGGVATHRSTSPSPVHITGGRGGEGQEELEEEEDAEQKVTAILPDIEFVMKGGTAAAGSSSSGGTGGVTGSSAVTNTNTGGSKRLELTYKRSNYQFYFSDLGVIFDNSNHELNNILGRYNKLAASFSPSAIHKSEKEREDSFSILLWALPVLLKYLPLDQIILALGCAVTEMKIIVKHKDFHVISTTILAIIHLLKPLKWCSPVIVILPDDLIDFIESPVPIIIGLQKLPDDFLLLERFVVIDPGENIVHLNPVDVVESHTIWLPHAYKLVNALKSSAEVILKTTKRKKHHPNKTKRTNSSSDLVATASSTQGAVLSPLASGTTPSFIPPSGGGGRNLKKTGQASSRLVRVNNTWISTKGIDLSSPAAAGDTSSIPLPTAPVTKNNNTVLPVELDTGSNENIQLLAAVKAFSEVVHNHIFAILNTALQRQQETRQAARSKRRMLISTNTNTGTSNTTGGGGIGGGGSSFRQLGRGAGTAIGGVATGPTTITTTTTTTPNNNNKSEGMLGPGSMSLSDHGTAERGTTTVVTDASPSPLLNMTATSTTAAAAAAAPPTTNNNNSSSSSSSNYHHPDSADQNNMNHSNALPTIAKAALSAISTASNSNNNSNSSIPYYASSQVTPNSTTPLITRAPSEAAAAIAINSSNTRDQNIMKPPSQQQQQQQHKQSQRHSPGNHEIEDRPAGSHALAVELLLAADSTSGRSQQDITAATKNNNNNNSNNDKRVDFDSVKDSPVGGAGDGVAGSPINNRNTKLIPGISPQRPVGRKSRVSDAGNNTKRLLATAGRASSGGGAVGAEDEGGGGRLQQPSDQVLLSLHKTQRKTSLGRHSLPPTATGAGKGFNPSTPGRTMSSVGNNNSQYQRLKDGEEEEEEEEEENAGRTVYLATSNNSNNNLTKKNKREKKGADNAGIVDRRKTTGDAAAVSFLKEPNNRAAVTTNTANKVSRTVAATTAGGRGELKRRRTLSPTVPPQQQRQRLKRNASRVSNASEPPLPSSSSLSRATKGRIVGGKGGGARGGIGGRSKTATTPGGDGAVAVTTTGSGGGGGDDSQEEQGLDLLIAEEEKDDDDDDDVTDVTDAESSKMGRGGRRRSTKRTTPPPHRRHRQQDDHGNPIKSSPLQQQEGERVGEGHGDDDDAVGGGGGSIGGGNGGVMFDETYSDVTFAYTDIMGAPPAVPAAAVPAVGRSHHRSTFTNNRTTNNNHSNTAAPRPLPPLAPNSPLPLVPLIPPPPSATPANNNNNIIPSTATTSVNGNNNKNNIEPSLSAAATTQQGGSKESPITVTTSSGGGAGVAGGAGTNSSRSTSGNYSAIAAAVVAAAQATAAAHRNSAAGSTAIAAAYDSDFADKDSVMGGYESVVSSSSSLPSLPTVRIASKDFDA